MRHNHTLVKYFAFLWPMIFLLDINPWITYGSFCVFLCLGIELGLHRIVCHNMAVKNYWRHLYVFLGMMTYSGGVKNSALSHFQHHMHTDTAKDVSKGFGIKADFTTIPMSNKRKIIRRLEKDPLLMKMDNHHNALFVVFHTLALLVLGLENGLAYVVLPASMAVFFHDYVAVRWLHRWGYETFETDDHSKNSLLLYPLMWGANFHNNHHGVRSFNNSHRWWEIDFIYYLTWPTHETKSKP